MNLVAKVLLFRLLMRTPDSRPPLFPPITRACVKGAGSTLSSAHGADIAKILFLVGWEAYVCVLQQRAAVIMSSSKGLVFKRRLTHLEESMCSGGLGYVSSQNL